MASVSGRIVSRKQSLRLWVEETETSVILCAEQGQLQDVFELNGTEAWVLAEAIGQAALHVGERMGRGKGVEGG